MSELEFKDDPDLLSEEKETTIWFGCNDDRATVHTDESALARRLLKHPESEEVHRYSTGDVVHGIRVTIPVNCLLIKRDARSRNWHSEVVSRSVLN